MVEILSGRVVGWCKIHNKGFYNHCDLCSPSIIKDPNVKRSYVRKVKNTIWERFHNYGVKFVADVMWDLILVDPTRLNNNVSYKRIDFSDAIVKVFRRSILVTLRSSREFNGLSVRDAEEKSKQLVNNVLDQLPSSIVVHDRSVVNLHNAFVNHPTALHGVTVTVDGSVRVISDNSKGHSEFEFVDPIHAVSDSEILEKFNADLIVNNPDPLSSQQSKLNHVVNILDRYATQMELHLVVEEKTSKTLDKIGNYFDSLAVVSSKSPGRSMKPRRSLGVTSPRVRR